MRTQLNIHAYNGYYHDGVISVRGRVLRDPAVESQPSDSKWTNLKNSWRRFRSNEVADFGLELVVGDKRFSTCTDDEGYFSFDQKVAYRSKTDISICAKEGVCHAVAPKIFIVSSELIVVSDIDDTIIKTQVSSVLKLRLLYNTIFKNAYQRLPIPGMPDVFQGLEDKYKAMFFYISKSPHNLYPYLIRFLRHNAFPAGVLMLRDFGWHLLSKKSSFGEKYKVLDDLFQRFTDKQFILIGDAAEKDADIYSELAHKYPTQCTAICIRAVGRPKNLMRIQEQLMHQSQIPFFIFHSEHELREQLDGVLI